ncbi:DUF4118 domain-containing protein [Oryzomonas sagensis]|uniref:DUF4118 domain-containing protein n=1 Tax=Oryzomonas sagensis TaxID=2603857 RepID=A0ABQ6TKT9_9BACT|nr:DUF4118 domain-containing protein [Oryzomonas sagensis]KAB0668826.1 DUF4118 domain-containing protein [Oryzomonas sagensis]
MGRTYIVPPVLAPSPARDRAVYAVSLIMLLLIGWLDYATGYEFGFFIFYFIPVSVSAWLGGKRPGLFMAGASAICWYFSDKYTNHPYSRAYFIYWEMFMRLISFLTTALTIAKIRQMLLNEMQLNQRLEEALHELGKLRESVQGNEPSPPAGHGGTPEGIKGD